MIDARGAAQALKAAIARGDVDVTSLYGGARGGPRMRCPLHNGGDPNFEVYEDGAWRCHSRCGGGDIFGFVAARDLNIPPGTPLRGVHFTDAVQRTFDLLGADLDAYGCSQPDPARKGKPFPDAKEVSRLLAHAHEVPCTGEVFSIASRPRPGIGTNALVAQLGLCIELRAGDDRSQRPKWAQSWRPGKLFALYDEHGRLATVQLRPDDPEQPKSKNPPNTSPRAWLMNAPMLSLMRGESREEQDRAKLLGYATARESAVQLGIVITEGPPAWAAWSRKHAGPVGGIPGQEPSAAWLGRLPIDAPILLDFDPDPTGVTYLRAALRGLVRHTDVRLSARMRWMVARLADAERNAAAVQAALVDARKTHAELCDPDEVDGGPSVDTWGFEPLAAEARAELVAQGAAFGAKWTEALRTNEEGKILASEGNIIASLKADPRWAGVLGRDERSDQITLLKAPPVPDLAGGSFPRDIRDEDASYVGAWFERELGIEFKNGSIHRALAAVAGLAPFDRVRDYLRSLTWDRVSRLDTWLADYLGADDTPLVRAIGAKWMISGVARTFQPGCKADYVLVLEGVQGARKSTAFATLCPDPAWFTDAVPDLSREKAVAEIVCSGAWICELPELDSVARADVSAIKAFLTRQEERFRAAYGRHTRRRPRRVIFGASTNEGAYLRDQTGNRRFWPVLATATNIEGLREVRDQLWAEAAYRYQHGETWYLDDPDLEREAAAEQETRREIDPWEEVIRSYLETWRDIAEQAAASNQTCRLVDLVTACLEKLDIKVAVRAQRESRRVTAILRALGWSRIQRRDGDGGTRRWAWEPSAAWLDRAVSPRVSAPSPRVSPPVGRGENVMIPGMSPPSPVSPGTRAREGSEITTPEKIPDAESVVGGRVTSGDVVTRGDDDEGDDPFGGGGGGGASDPDRWSDARMAAERDDGDGRW